MTLIQVSGSGTATWTCIPNTSSRRATYCSCSSRLRYRSRGVIRWFSDSENGCVEELPRRRPSGPRASPRPRRMSLRSRRASSTPWQMPVATSADDSNSSGITRFAHGASGSASSTSSMEPASSSVLASSSMYSSSTPIVSGGPEPYLWSTTLTFVPLLPLPPALTDASVPGSPGSRQTDALADDPGADADPRPAEHEHRGAQRRGEQQRGRDPGGAAEISAE